MQEIHPQESRPSQKKASFWTPTKDAELIALWRQTSPRLTEKQIALRLGVDPDAVDRRARVHLKLPNRGSFSAANSPWSADRDALLAKLWHQDDPRLSGSQIADMLNATPEAVECRRHDLGLPNRGYFGVFWTPDKDAMLAELRQQLSPWLSMEGIAQQIGTSIDGVRNRSIVLSLPPRPKQPAWSDEDGQIQKLIILRCVKKLPFKDCAKALGISCAAAKARFPRIPAETVLAVVAGSAPRELKPRRCAPPSVQQAVASLKETVCHWPSGDPFKEGFHFCGRMKSFGVPYCETHAAIAYNPLASKRRAA